MTIGKERLAELEVKAWEHSHGNTEYTKAKAYGRMLLILTEREKENDMAKSTAANYDTKIESLEKELADVKKHNVIMQTALIKAAQTFAKYAMIHGNKEVPNLEKVVANVNLSNEMTRALQL